MNRSEVPTSVMLQLADFADKIAPIYQLLKWEWKNDEMQRIPNAVDLTSCLVRLYGTVSSGSYTSSSTGGLEVHREEDDSISVSFSLTCFPKVNSL